MLNFPTQDPDDIELLEDSFNVIESKNSLEIVSDPDAIESVFKLTVNSLSLPSDCAVSFANLFKINSTSGKFYIAQLFQDFGFCHDSKILRDQYRYHVIGIAHLTEDFGNILIRPESSADRLVGRIIKSDIEFPNAPKFNEQYYVVADKPDMAAKLFTTATLSVLSKIRKMTLKVNRDQLFITFENEMNRQHSANAEKVLMSIPFLGEEF